MLSFGYGNLIGVDGGTFFLAKSRFGENALNDRIFAGSVFVNVGGLCSDEFLQFAILSTEIEVGSQCVANGEVVSQRKRACDNHIRVGAGEPIRLPKSPTLRNTEFAARLEPESDEN